MTFDKIRRSLVLGSGAALGLTALMATTAVAADPIKIGVVSHLTGPLAGGDAVTHIPNIELWSKQVNDRGGLMVDGARRPVEIISYDDKTRLCCTNRFLRGLPLSPDGIILRAR